MTDPQLPPPVPPAPSAYQAPPGAYQVPVGGYAAPLGTYQVPAVEVVRSKVLGALALVVALITAVLTPIISGFAGYEIGRRIPNLAGIDDSDSLAFLAPARDQVLWAEISFWAGTILGITAIVLGIIAIVRKQGRGLGVTGLIIASIAPAIFFITLFIGIGIGGSITHGIAT